MIAHKKADVIRAEAVRALSSAIRSLDVSATVTGITSRHKADSRFTGELDTLLRLAVTRFDADKLVAEAEQDMG